MTKKKKNRILQNKLKKELDKEKSRLSRLKIDYPELFRKCGNDQICCQATNKDRSFCNRPAMTTKTYSMKLRCCFLCWQHSLAYGVYAINKLANLLYSSSMDMDTYCSIYPHECEELLRKQREYDGLQ
jgi:hypothetical protein